MRRFQVTNRGYLAFLNDVSREHADRFGIVRIQPPASWRPPLLAIPTTARKTT